MPVHAVARFPSADALIDIIRKKQAGEKRMRRMIDARARQSE